MNNENLEMENKVLDLLLSLDRNNVELGIQLNETILNNRFDWFEWEICGLSLTARTIGLGLANDYYLQLRIANIHKLIGNIDLPMFKKILDANLNTPQIKKVYLYAAKDREHYKTIQDILNMFIGKSFDSIILDNLLDGQYIQSLNFERIGLDILKIKSNEIFDLNWINISIPNVKELQIDAKILDTKPLVDWSNLEAEQPIKILLGNNQYKYKGKCKFIFPKNRKITIKGAFRMNLDYPENKDGRVVMQHLKTTYPNIVFTDILKQYNIHYRTC